MGYLHRDVWKQNLVMLLTLGIFVGIIVGAVVLARRSQRSSGTGDTANDVRLVVEGSASKGVAVTFSDSNGASVLQRDAALPFHQSVPTNGGSFYQLQAQILGGGGGSISCQIALGSVVAVHHASAGRACVAGLGHGRDGWAPS